MRHTSSLAAVAIALMSEPDGRHWGYALSSQSGVRSGVLYPILARMLADGWLTDGWETDEEVAGAKRPARRYYRITDAGSSELGAVLARAPRPRRANAAVPAVI